MIKKFFLFFSAIFCVLAYAMQPKKSNHFRVVTASYNNKPWCENNIGKLLGQRYHDYTLDYTVEPCSDGTAEKIKEIINSQDELTRKKIVFRENGKRRFALANQHRAIMAAADDDVVVIYDGDDWFHDLHVLSYLDSVYQDPNVWITYGQFEEYPSGKKGFCVPYEQKVMDANDFRKISHGPSHLRTFRAALFKKIATEDLQLSQADIEQLQSEVPQEELEQFNLKAGDFFPMTSDLAMMFPMLEMARKGHIKFIDRILLTYNSVNNFNDHKVSKKLQRQIDLIVRIRKRYEALDSLDK